MIPLLVSTRRQHCPLVAIQKGAEQAFTVLFGALVGVGVVVLLVSCSFAVVFLKMFTVVVVLVGCWGFTTLSPKQ